MADHRLPGGHGRRRRADHAVDPVDPRERVPRRGTGRRRSRSGRPPPASPARSVRWRAASCSRTSGSGRCSSSTSPSSRSPSSAAGSSSRSRRTPTRRVSTRWARCCRSSGISSLVFGLIQAPDKGWGSAQTLGAFAVAAVVLTAFVLWELHVDEPMLDMRFFRNPSFSTGQRRHDARVPRHVRRHVPDDAVLPARARLLAAVGGAAIAPDGADHDHRRAAHAEAEREVRREPCRRFRDGAHRGRLRRCSPASASTRRTGASSSRSSRSSRAWRWRCRR